MYTLVNLLRLDEQRVSRAYVYIQEKYTTILPDKSDSDVMFC